QIIFFRSGNLTVDPLFEVGRAPPASRNGRGNQSRLQIGYRPDAARGLDKADEKEIVALRMDGFEIERHSAIGPIPDSGVEKGEADPVAGRCDDDVEFFLGAVVEADDSFLEQSNIAFGGNFSVANEIEQFGIDYRMAFAQAMGGFLEAILARRTHKQ